MLMMYRFANTYFPNTIREWNLLDPNTRNSESISIFKASLLKKIRPRRNSLFGVKNILGCILLTRLRVEFSALREHRFRHNFDCLSPLCLCGEGDEDNEHFFLHCRLFIPLRKDLFESIYEICGINFFSSLRPNEICRLLLFGSDSLNIFQNKLVVEASISFIKASERFSSAFN